MLLVKMGCHSHYVPCHTTHIENGIISHFSTVHNFQSHAITIPFTVIYIKICLKWDVPLYIPHLDQNLPKVGCPTYCDTHLKWDTTTLI